MSQKEQGKSETGQPEVVQKTYTPRVRVTDSYTPDLRTYQPKLDTSNQNSPAGPPTGGSGVPPLVTGTVRPEAPPTKSKPSE